VQLNFLAQLDPTPYPTDIIYRNPKEIMSFLSLLPQATIAVCDTETARYHQRTNDSQYCSTRKVLEGDALNPFRLSIRLIQIYLPEFDRTLIFDAWLDDLALHKEIFKAFFEGDALKIFHNASFDVQALLIDLGIEVKHSFCTRIMSNALHAGCKYEKHDLASCVKRETGEIIDKSLGSSDWGVLSPLSAQQITYARDDLRHTYTIFLSMQEKLKQIDRTLTIYGEEPDFSIFEIVKFHCDSIIVFAKMLQHGMPRDLTDLDTIEQQYRDRIDELAAPALKILGYGFSLTTQPAKLSKRILDLTGILMTKEALTVEDLEKEDTLFGEQLSKDSLALLQAQAPTLKFHSQQYPWLDGFVKAKALLKQLDFIKHVKKHQKEYFDCRLRGQINSLGSTGVGRSTSSSGGAKNSMVGLNLQNIVRPPDFAKGLPALRALIKPRSGWKLVICDAASSHIRILAALCDAPELKEILLNPVKQGLMHAYLASEASRLQGKFYTPEEIEAGRKKYPELELLRNVSKTCFYSKLNMASAFSIQQSLFKAGIFASLEMVEAVSKAWDGFYKNVQQYQFQAIRLAHDFGTRSLRQYRRKDGSKYAIPYLSFRLPCGRYFSCEMRLKEDGRSRAKAGDILAAHWLSLEAIAFHIAMQELHKLWQGQEEFRRLILFCHDELVAECEESWAERTSREVNSAVSSAYDIILKGKIPSGISDNTWEKCIVDNYSQK
jgi:3'-5' exonuclease